MFSTWIFGKFSPSPLIVLRSLKISSRTSVFPYSHPLILSKTDTYHQGNYYDISISRNSTIWINYCYLNTIRNLYHANDWIFLQELIILTPCRRCQWVTSNLLLKLDCNCVFTMTHDAIRYTYYTTLLSERFKQARNKPDERISFFLTSE